MSLTTAVGTMSERDSGYDLKNSKKLLRVKNSQREQVKDNKKIISILSKVTYVGNACRFFHDNRSG